MACVLKLTFIVWAQIRFLVCSSQEIRLDSGGDSSGGSSSTSEEEDISVKRKQLSMGGKKKAPAAPTGGRSYKSPNSILAMELMRAFSVTATVSLRPVCQ
jgi:hypothetical protein